MLSRIMFCCLVFYLLMTAAGCSMPRTIALQELSRDKMLLPPDSNTSTITIHSNSSHYLSMTLLCSGTVEQTVAWYRRSIPHGDWKEENYFESRGIVTLYFERPSEPARDSSPQHRESLSVTVRADTDPVRSLAEVTVIGHFWWDPFSRAARAIFELPFCWMGEGIRYLWPLEDFLF